MRRQYVVVVADGIRKPWPAAVTLLKHGLPLAQVRRYQLVRREMTAGLKDRLVKGKN